MFNIDDRVGTVRSNKRGTIVETVDRWHLVSMDGHWSERQRFDGRDLVWYHEEDLLPACSGGEINNAFAVLAHYKLV